jgi:hypothetical protein
VTAKRILVREDAVQVAQAALMFDLDQCCCACAFRFDPGHNGLEAVALDDPSL